MDSAGKKRPRKTKLVCRQVVELDEELQKLINATQDITSNETDDIYDKVVPAESDLNGMKTENLPDYDEKTTPNHEKVKKPRKINKIKKQVKRNVKKPAKHIAVKSSRTSKEDKELAKSDKDEKHSVSDNVDMLPKVEDYKKPEVDVKSFQFEIPPELDDDENPPEFDEEELEKDKEWSTDFKEKLFKLEAPDEIETIAEVISNQSVTNKLNKLKANDDDDEENKSFRFSVNIEVEEFDYEHEMDKIDDDFCIETSILEEVSPRNDLFENPYAFHDHDYEKPLDLLSKDDINQIIHEDVETNACYSNQSNKGHDPDKQIDNLNDLDKRQISDTVNHDILQTTKESLWKDLEEMKEYVGPVHQSIQLHMKNNFGNVFDHVFEKSELDEKLNTIFNLYKTLNQTSYTFTKIYRHIYCYKCYICRKAWYNLYDLKVHLKNHKENYNLNMELEQLTCNVVAFFGTQPNKEQIPITSKCPSCAKSFEDHETYSCFGCLQTFQNCAKLRLHEGICPKFKLVYKQKYGEDAEYLHCIICRLCYFSVDEFKSHFIVKHTPRSDYVMPDNTLKYCCDCKNHVPCLQFHTCATKSLFYVCVHCDKKFCNRDMLRLHEINSSAISCHFCGTKLKRSCQEADHMLQHTDKYLRVYRCVLCVKTLYFFKNITDFREHKELLHPTCNAPQFGHQMMILPVKCFDVETDDYVQSQIDEEAKLLEEQLLICSTATVETPEDSLLKPKEKPNILSKTSGRKNTLKTNKCIEENISDNDKNDNAEVQNDNAEVQNDTAEVQNDTAEVQNDNEKSNQEPLVNDKNEIKSVSKDQSNEESTNSNNNEDVSKSLTEGMSNVFEKSHSPVLEEATMEVLTNLDIKLEPIEYDEDLCGSIYNMSFYTEEMNITTNKYVDIDPKIVLDTFLRKIYKCSKCDYIGCHKEYKLHVAGRCKPKPTLDPLQPGNTKGNVIFRCTKCNEESISFQGYIRHLKDHGFAKYQCPECRASFKCNTTLANHLIGHIKDMFQRIIFLSAEQVRQNYCYRCRVCKLELMDRDFFEHWESHLPLTVLKQEYDDIYRDMDPLSMVEPETLLTEPDVDVKPPLDLNGSGMTTTDPMLIHIDGVTMNAIISYLLRSKLNRTKVPKCCLLCRRKFQRMHDAKRHIIEHLLIQAFAHKPVNNGLKCQICGMLHDKPDRFKHHMREHARLPIYRCEICNRSFSDSSNFTKHKKVHNFRFLICDHCGRKFQSKTCMIKHLETHLKRNLRSCKHCTLKFSLRSALTKHIKRVHLQQKGTHQCPICRQKLPSTKEKLDHMWLVHKDREVKADCPLCGKMFRKITDVNKHLREKHPGQPMEIETVSKVD